MPYYVVNIKLGVGMSMNTKNMQYMNYSINISKGGSGSVIRVGAVLVSDMNEIICSAYTNEEYGKSWCAVLLSKVYCLGVSNAKGIYLTVNTLAGDESFELNQLLKIVHINEIYVGLPDPSLTCYLEDDPIISLENVYRYPDNLLREILALNQRFYAVSKQSIKHCSYYSENRISNLVIEKLTSRGYTVSKEELKTNKQKQALASLISDRYKIDYSEAINVVYNVISEAFDSKYGRYNYQNDARILDSEWRERFISFYDESSSKNIFSNNIINVGVGGGHEALELFSNCKSITFVDIAQEGLKKIKEHIPLSNIIVASADNLSHIADNSYDLYVSLRTFNSSFFDIKEAISEANRVLKSNAVIIISVANGFLCNEQQSVIPGLIISGTDFVDIYRGMDTIKQMSADFQNVGFRNIRCVPTNTEIYMSAVSA